MYRRVHVCVHVCVYVPVRVCVCVRVCMFMCRAGLGTKLGPNMWLPGPNLVPDC